MHTRTYTHTYSHTYRNANITYYYSTSASTYMHTFYVIAEVEQRLRLDDGEVAVEYEHLLTDGR